MSQQLKILFILIIAGCPVSAQFLDELVSNDFNAITVEDGLSQNTVNCILKDRDGFLWFGTRSGLNRYDSYDITMIKENISGYSLFNSSEIFDLFEDARGWIWIATNTGLYYYDPLQERVFLRDLFETPNSGTTLYCIVPESDSMLWLGTSDGLYLYHKKMGIQDEFKYFPKLTDTISNPTVYALADDGNFLWIGTSNGLFRLEKSIKSFSHFSHDDYNGSPGGIIRSLNLADDGKLWIGTEFNGISCLDTRTNHFQSYSVANSKLPHNDIWDIFRSDDRNIWLATNGGGLSHFDFINKEFKNFQHDPSNIHSLSNNSTYSILVDREGILWVGTFAGGVNYTLTDNLLFKKLSYQANNPNSVCDSKIRSLYVDKYRNLWLGTMGGLSKLDYKTRKFSSFSADPSRPGSLSFNTVTVIYQDSRDRIWIGTYSGGLNRLDADATGFRHYYHDPNNSGTISSDNIFCIIEDTDRNIWIGTHSGLNRYNEQTQTFESFQDYYIRDMALTEEGDLMLAMNGGLAVFNRQTGSYKFFESQILSRYNLNNLYLGDNERVWFGTLGSGLGYLNLRNNHVELFTEQNGMPSNYVSSLLPESDSIFWIGTYRGLTRFNKNSRQFRNYGLADGLPGLEFFPRSAIKLPDGNLAFGSSRGLVFFHPDSIQSIRQNPRIILTGLKIDNAPVSIGTKASPLSKSISHTDRIVLKYSQNDFSIDFVAINFSSPGKNNYEYLLENYTDEWREIGNTRSVSFTNLNSGKYLFRVKLKKDFEGNEEVQEAAIAIEISPSFWGTWWFRGMVFLFSVLVLILYNKVSLISTKQKKLMAIRKLEYEKHEEFIQVKLRFFSNISHEFRTPLTLILDPLQKLLLRDPDRDNRHLLKLIEKNTQRLMKLIDQILDFRKVENDAMNLQVANTDIMACITDIFDSFSEMALHKDVAFNLEKSVQALPGWVDIDKIEKILYNIISNAFKFTPAGGNILLKAETAGAEIRVLRLTLQDNGIGIRADSMPKIFDRFYSAEDIKRGHTGGAGLGLSIVKKLVELHHGSVDVSSQENEGTSFIISIPIDRNEYSDQEVSSLTGGRSAMMVDTLDVAGSAGPGETLSLQSGDLPLILIVEDETDIREYIAHTLCRSFRVLQASNGLEGLKLATRHLPELILSDTIMPEMDGIELCRQIKENKATALTPFIFLSVWSSDDFKLKGLHTGADDYITKPFNSEILQTKIANTIENRRKLREAFKARLDISPGEIQLDSFQKRFIAKVQVVLEKYINDPDFTSRRFQEEMNMSQSLLYRNLKQLTGLSSNELIRDYRLKRAAQILRADSGLSISEVAGHVGFIDSKYFSHCFKKKYYRTPTEFALSKE